MRLVAHRTFLSDAAQQAIRLDVAPYGASIMTVGDTCRRCARWRSKSHWAAEGTSGDVAAGEHSRSSEVTARHVATLSSGPGTRHHRGRNRCTGRLDRVWEREHLTRRGDDSAACLDHVRAGDDLPFHV